VPVGGIANDKRQTFLRLGRRGADKRYRNDSQPKARQAPIAHVRASAPLEGEAKNLLALYENKREKGVNFDSS